MKKLLPIIKTSLLLAAIVMMGYSARTQTLASYTTLIIDKTPSQNPRSHFLVNVLNEIEIKYNVSFHYNHALIKGLYIADPAPFNRKEDKLEEVLQKILDPLNLKFRKVGNKIYVIKREKEEKGIGGVNNKPETSDNNEKFDLSSLVDVGMNKILPPMQDFIVSGKVTSHAGESIPGVNILLKGTTTGTVTDVDGNYSLNVPSSQGTLVFSYIGFIQQEVEINGRASINIALMEDMQTLSEVVVVGYGTQKEVNLTGSVSTVSPEELAKVSAPTLTQALMGRAAGVFIKNESGQPGTNKTSFNIRGFGEPLIIVDGTPVSSSVFQQIDPNDIEKFSVLKDAAAASVYGARAGNGVILVTTRRGELSAPKFNYKADFGQQFFTILPEFVSSYQYFQMRNLVQWNENKEPIYSQDEIDMYKKYNDNSNPDYPNNQMTDLVFRDYAPQSQHNINVRGGTDQVKYFVSGGWFNQDGMYRSDEMKYDRYSLRSNLDIKLMEKLNLGVNLSFINEDYIGPRQEMEGARGAEQGVMQRIHYQRPFFSDINPLPDPNKMPAYGSGASDNPMWFTYSRYVGYRKFRSQYGDVRFDLTYDLPYGFQVRANIDFNTKIYNYKRKTLAGEQYDFDEETETYIYRKQSFPFNSLEESREITNNSTQQYFLTWNKSFGDHNFSSLFVYEQLSNDFDRIDASRIRYEFDLDYLFAGPDLDKDNYGIGREGGRKAYIGRITYDYMGKYLLEVNARSDASPNFPTDTRWGFFPSGSIGWRISEESFMDNISFLNNLKVRASYGKLGYDGAGAFRYLETYRLDGKYIYDVDELQSGLIADAMPNPYITWEKMTTSNVGVDFNVWDNKLSGTFDYFYRKRTDVLGTRIKQIPNIVGAVLPEENYREFDNRGWEFSLDHHHNIGGFSYSFGGNVSWNREKALVVDQSEFNTMEAFRTGNLEGEWTDRAWIYPSDGLFQTQEEIDNWAIIDGNSNAKIQPGDIKFIDTNGDGRITGEDRILGGRGNTPRFTYGLNMSASWKGFDFSMLWQGSGLYNVDLQRNIYFARGVFFGNSNPMTFMYNDAYVPEGNPWLEDNTTNAIYPRYRSSSYHQSHPNYRLNSGLWLVNGAYVRLKNIQLGYTLPKKLTDRLGIENTRVYVGGYNVLTFSEFDYLDPEADNDPARGAIFTGAYHPQLGTYNLGIEINF